MSFGDYMKLNKYMATIICLLVIIIVIIICKKIINSNIEKNNVNEIAKNLALDGERI